VTKGERKMIFQADFY